MYDQKQALEELARYAETVDPIASKAERVTAAKVLFDELRSLHGKAGIRVEPAENPRGLRVTVGTDPVLVSYNDSGKVFVARPPEYEQRHTELSLTYNRAKQRLEGSPLPRAKDDVRPPERRDALVEIALGVLQMLSSSRTSR